MVSRKSNFFDVALIGSVSSFFDFESGYIFFKASRALKAFEVFWTVFSAICVYFVN